LAEKANDLVDGGDSYTAQLLTTKILPTPNQPDYPKEYNRNTSIGTLKLIMKLGFRISK